ncbi:MAG TPA: tetratricopeptide repeat protein [Planctomycetes bacterium]|nr:tetratricopeptide repeat protein [Planctomycetota bacterium]
MGECETSERPGEGSATEPAEPSWRGRAAALLFVLLLAACVRGVFWGEVSRSSDFAHLAVDAEGYDEQARGVLAGTWPGDQVFYQDALYPYFLAAHYRLLGDRPEDVFRTQLVLGTATAGLALVLAWLLFGSFEGILAGVLAATFAPSLFYETLLLKASLTLFVLTGGLVAVLWARRRGTLGWFFLSGVLLGGAALLRGNLLALVPLTALWTFALPRDGKTRRVRALAQGLAILAGAAIAILPVTVHNVRAGDFVLITSQAGQNFYIGNNPVNSTGSYAPPAGVRGVQKYEQIDFARLAEREVGRALKPSERSRFWFEKSFAFMRSQPSKAAALLWKKVLLFLNHLEVPDNADFETTASEVPLLRGPLPTFPLVLVLAAASLVLVRWNRELGLVAIAGAAIFATVVAFYVFSRYRLSIVPVLIVFAAALPRALVTQLEDRNLPRLAGALVVGGLAWGITSRDVWEGSRSMLHYNRALYAIEHDAPDEVPAHLERALELDPCNWYALLLRAQLAAKAGHGDAARSDFERAIACAPGAAEPRYKLGLFLLARNDLEGARAAFESALQAEPFDVAVVKLAETESRLGQLDAARARLDALIERRPRYTPALELALRLAKRARDPERVRELEARLASDAKR